jgi:phosphopantetheinyl transferase
LSTASTTHEMHPLSVKDAAAVDAPDAGVAHLWWWRFPGATRFADAQTRSRWAWTQVRHCLARYAGVTEDELLIRRSANGKPQAPQLDQAFSLSHDESVALLAVAPVAQLGVDVHHDRPFANPRRLAQRLYDGHEFATWCASAPEQQLQHLRTRFCCTEAVVKALDWRLWPALGSIHFVRQGRLARVPLKRAQLHLLDGRRATLSFALASETPITEIQHREGAARAR